MIKRPLNSQFVCAVIMGRKTTTIRTHAWPVSKPIMLYHWAGAAYRSRHMDVAVITVNSVQPISIQRTDADVMRYTGVDENIHQTEGFESPSAMDEWFRRLLKPGETRSFFLMKCVARHELSR
jgi:hypothetical protein